jgi:N utilization substance protein B
VTDTQDSSTQPSDKKTADPRHVRRIHWMQNMFAYSFYAEEDLRQQFFTHHPELQELITQIVGLDQEIQTVAPERPLADINKVDLAILRIIVFEWKTSQTPKKVLIDEGVELAKEFGTESSFRFVNGVLAKLLN